MAGLPNQVRFNDDSNRLGISTEIGICTHSSFVAPFTPCGGRGGDGGGIQREVIRPTGLVFKLGAEYAQTLNGVLIPFKQGWYSNFIDANPGKNVQVLIPFKQGWYSNAADYLGARVSRVLIPFKQGWYSNSVICQDHA